MQVATLVTCVKMEPENDSVYLYGAQGYPHHRPESHIRMPGAFRICDEGTG